MPLLALAEIAPLIQAEHEEDGIAAVNIDPGFTRTEAMDELGLPELAGAPPEVTGAFVACLATNERAREWRGRRAS